MAINNLLIYRPWHTFSAFTSTIETISANLHYTFGVSFTLTQVQKSPYLRNLADHNCASDTHDRAEGITNDQRDTSQSRHEVPFMEEEKLLDNHHPPPTTINWNQYFAKQQHLQLPNG